jgi:uncharacterized protein YeaO (DUF488 family)
VSAHRPAQRSKTPGFRVKRIYEPASTDDGFRVLVDRLWPRGLSKQKAHIDAWLKEIAPSDALRKQFHGHAETWKDFVAAYRHELKNEPAKSADTSSSADRHRRQQADFKGVHSGIRGALGRC